MGGAAAAHHQGTGAQAHGGWHSACCRQSKHPSRCLTWPYPALPPPRLQSRGYKAHLDLLVRRAMEGHAWQADHIVPVYKVC